MSKSLIIAEKPSVATDLSRALGGFKKVDDYYENDRYIISSAIGFSPNFSGMIGSVSSRQKPYFFLSISSGISSSTR